MLDKLRLVIGGPAVTACLLALVNHWQQVAKLILAKEDVLTVSRALELELFYDAKLDVSA
jgi:hypothetical protein